MRSIQSTFTIAGLQIDPQVANWRMLKNSTVDIPFRLTNTGDTQLTNLRFTTETSTGITAGVILPSPLAGGGQGEGVTIAAGKTLDLTLKVSSSSSAPDTGYVTLIAAASPSSLAGEGQGEGVTARLDVNLSLVTAIPIISTSPSYIDTGMVRGDQKIVNFTITNTGAASLTNARLEGPSTSWMSLTVNPNIGELKPGASLPIGILLRPPDTLAQGVYDDRIVIYSDNHIPYTYHIQVTVTSNAVGNVMFDVLNEFMEDVPDATITFQHQLLTELIYTVKTGTDGTAMMFDIPEGRYTYTVSPPAGHLPTSGVFEVTPGQTSNVYIALELKLVEITWSVVPTTIQDVYEIKITQTFETNVPAPVLVTEPPVLNLPEMQPGQVLNGEFTVTNYGLIAVDNVKIQFPSSILDYDIEVYTAAIPKRIGAMQKITVPYKVTKRQALAFDQGLSNNIDITRTLLFDEITGYGASCPASTCIQTCGEAVICPNTPQQKTTQVCTCHTISAPAGGSCPVGGGGTGIGSYWGSGWGIGGGGQSGGGGVPQPSGAPLNTGNPCNCKPNCTPCPEGVCVNGACTAIPPDVPGDCKKYTCDVDEGIINVPSDGESPPQGPPDDCQKEVCRNGNSIQIPDDSEIPPQSSPNDCRREICINGSRQSIANDSEIPLDECMMCRFGDTINRPNGTICTNDGLMCTSSDGIHIGPDACVDGTCFQKEIADRDTGTAKYEFDPGNLIKVINKAVYALKISGCNVQSPSITGGINVALYERCCEGEGIKPGRRYGGLISLNFPGAECFIPGLSTPPLLSKLVAIGAAGGMGGSCQVSGGGDSNPCDQDGCGWYISGGCTVNVSGSVQGQILDPKVVKVSGGIQGSGSVSYIKNCKGSDTNMCIGPLSFFVKVKLVVSEKSYNWIVPNTRVCTD